MSNQQTFAVKKCKTVQEAIDMDKSLQYVSLTPPVFERILEDKDESLDYEGLDLTKSILGQVREYKRRPEGVPQLITYKGKVIRAVSALFRPIPLEKVWNNTLSVLGNPISERAISQGIVTEFEPVHTHYDRSGQRKEAEYELKPTVVFAYNFAERSFQLGFCVGVMTCTNQLFFFCAEFRTRIVHNVFHMRKQDFKLEESIKQFKDNWTTVEKLIEGSKEKPVEEYDVPVMYWKASNGTQSHIKKMYETHLQKTPEGEPLVVNGKSVYKEPQSLWDITMNTTNVSTRMDNFNVGFETSSRSGNFLCANHNLKPHDYVLGLGYYLKALHFSSNDWEGLKLGALRDHVREIVKRKYIDEPVDSEDDNDNGVVMGNITGREGYHGISVPREEPKPKEEKRTNIPISDAKKYEPTTLRDYLYL